jgi:hypothetical protein
MQVDSIPKTKRFVRRVACLVLAGAAACSGGGNEPEPAPGFGMLSGQKVLVLPVQYVRQVPGGWVGRASNGRDAARQADMEVAFALDEQGGRAEWITPDEQVAELRRRPAIEVDPYALSAGEARQKGGNLRDVKDPLYGEIRLLAALLDTRYALWPLEIFYDEDEKTGSGRLAFRTFVLDARKGQVMWYGVIAGESEDEPASPAALAALAQRFAYVVSP